MRKIKIFEGTLDQCSFEDNNQALICEISENDPNLTDTMFVRIQSWDETKEHTQINQFVGKKIKITIETTDD